MMQRWETLTFLHWAFRPEVVQALLPSGLVVETFEGQAWVGLVPFHMTVGLGRTSSTPWIGRFHETNVRTYVRDRYGRSGLWFFSLDAARLGAVVTARASYRLPYFWSAMTLTRDANLVRYECSRRWPGSPGYTSRVEVEVGPPFEAEALTELDHFVTARWTMFSVSAAHRLHFTQAQHAPWPLRRVRVRVVDDELLRAAGLPPPQGPPLAHFSDEVTVRLGASHRVKLK
jgi:uncharacterized protein YqjF (DUF2071 family)